MNIERKQAETDEVRLDSCIFLTGDTIFGWLECFVDGQTEKQSEKVPKIPKKAKKPKATTSFKIWDWVIRFFSGFFVFLLI